MTIPDIGNPLVSVIVPCKNSEEFISLNLMSLLLQTYDNMEVIVVDNFSTDNTVKLALEFTDCVYQVGPERASQDNFGIRQAKGDIIYLTGSDFFIDPEYIEEGVKKIQEGYDAVYASVLTHEEVKHFWGKVKALERECYIGDNTIESARFFKKEVWEKLGGFDEKLVQIEEDFQHRLDSAGYRTGRINSREHHLHEESDLCGIYKKSKYYGLFMSHYLRKHKGRGWKQINPFRRFQKFYAHPMLLIGLVIYKIVQYSGGLVGMLKKGDI